MSETLDIANSATNAAGPLVSRRTMLTLTTTLGLSGLSALYARLVNPLINPPGLDFPSPGGEPPAGPPPRNSQHMAERFLASAPWAANAKYQMRTKEAFVYFEEWKRTENLQAVRFWPFAMIWMHNERALEEGPITIVSDEAQVRFATQFEITNDPGRVIASSLGGRATIRGPNNMRIDGRDFSYSESAARIWSNEPLTFAYGPNTGSAVGVQVDLLLAEKPSDHSLAVSGMRSIRLLENVRMDLVSEPGDKSPIGGAATTESTHAKVTSDGPFEYKVEQLVATYERNVRVETPNEQGQLDTLEAAKLELTFVPNPEKQKPAPPVAATTDPAAPPAETPPTDESGQFQSFETNLVFRTVHAEGPEVRLRSEERDVTALMTTLDYDASTRIVHMQDAQQVRVLNAGNELRSPAITLVHAEEGSNLQLVRCSGIGSMKHTDPTTGLVDLLANWEEQMMIQPDVESGLEVLELKRQAIVRQPLENAEMRAETILLWFARNTTPDEPGSPAAPSGPPVAGARPASSEERLARGLAPRKLLAIDRVTMESRDLRANTKRLEVWFEQAVAAAPPVARPPAGVVPTLSVPSVAPSGTPTPTTPADASDPFQGHPLRSATSTGSSAHSVCGHEGGRRMADSFAATNVSVATAAVAAADPLQRGPHSESADAIATPEQFFLSVEDSFATVATPPTAKAPTDGPLVVDADLIRVKAVRKARVERAGSVPTRPATAAAPGRTAEDLEVREVWTYGNVHVRQTHLDGEPPLEVTGQTLHVVNNGPNREVLHVYGSEPAPAGPGGGTREVTVPAHVRDRGMHIEGDRIHLDRGANEAWVDGAGLLQLPVDQSLDGEKLPEPQPLDVAWSERMKFNGLVAEFFGGVVTTTKTKGKPPEKGEPVVDEGRLRCEEMRVKLTKRISFAEAELRPGADRSRTAPRPASNRPTADGRPAKRDEGPQVATIQCLYGVVVHSTASEGSLIVGVRQAEFRQFDLDQTTGDTIARGPGTIKLWRRGTGRRAGQGPGAVVRSNAGVARNPNDWEFTHVDFAGVNEGNTQGRTSKFTGGVEITYGPVAAPLAVFDADNLPVNGGNLRSETLDLRFVDKTEKAAAYFTAFAEGNVYLQGREPKGEEFFVRADEATFDESKGQYVLRSKGDRKATISRRNPTGGYEKQNATRMVLVPSRNIFNLDQVSGLDGSG